MKINLIEYFEETLRTASNKTAILDGDKRITFEELEHKSKLLSTIISNVALVKNRPIGVYMPKSIEAIIANIATIYSGNIYMNLDVKTPLERINNILSLIEPFIIITNTKYYNSINELCSLNVNDIIVINIDEVDFNCNYNNEIILKGLSTIIDTDPLCIINTSGSTGTPKGVVLNHRSFFDFIARSQEEFKFTNSEIIGSLSPLVFDIYAYELCLLMANSATIVIIPDSLSAFPIKILNILAETKVSFIFWVPTIMVNIANMGLLDHVNLSSLKLVWFAGEVFPTKQFNIWRKSLQDTIFANLYGPIEITLDCTFYKIEREISDDEPIPIGFAYKNTDILILDDNNKRVCNKGIKGELCVRGTSLAMGYYNNPEKTAAAFVQNPLNNSYPEIIYRTGDIVEINDLGEIVFRGRKDSLVKHMGYRIELGEIEHIIVNTLKLVKNGCVVYQHDRKEITFFYEKEVEITPNEFRKSIGASLPKYMIPTVFYRLDELQRNTNGKIDRLFYNRQING